MTISAELKSQLQIAIMHVWNSSLCDALHCVSGTLSFITFGKIPFFAFCSIMRKKSRARGSLSQSDVIRKEPKAEEGKMRYRIRWKFHFHRENISSATAAVVFSTLEKFISKWVLSMFSHEFTSSE